MGDTAETSDSIMEWLSGTIRARLKVMTALLQRRFPDVQVDCYEGSVGQLTDFQGYGVGIEATLPSGDCVALDVTVAYLGTVPRVYGSVGWCAPSGSVEACTDPESGTSLEWPIASAVNLRRVSDELPRLVEALSAAIDRGEPRRGEAREKV